MKKIDRMTTHRLATALLGLLLATPGAWGQNGAGSTGPGRPPGTGKAEPTGATAALAPLISNKIQFHGQVPDNQTNQRFDPLDVCPNVVDPVGHGVQSQPYQFQFESNCAGNNSSTDCRFRPSFIWTVKYFTENGNSYTEQWQDRTSDDFSKIRLYLYDRVPYPASQFVAATPTSGQATQAGGNPRFSAVPYPNTGCLNPPGNTAQPGELITSMQLECTGYSCGVFGGDDRDAIQIRYYGRRPAAIALESAQPLCRNVPVSISASPVFAATNYLWFLSGLNGAVISNVNGPNATLDVSGVPAGTTSITLRVAAQDNAHCGGIVSETRELVVNLAQALPAPQNIQLSNGRCPTVGANDLKQLSVNAVLNTNSGTGYAWELTGNTAGAFFQKTGGPACPSCTADEAILTPNSGQFTAAVRARSTDCGGVTATQTQAFTINSATPTCPTTASFPAGLCLGGLAYPIRLDNAEPGTIYSISIINVQPSSASVNFVQNSGGAPSGNLSIQSGAPTSFDVSVFVVGSCPPVTARNCAPIRLTFGPGWCYQAPSPPPGPAPGPQLSQPTTTLYPNPTSGPVDVQSSGIRYEWVKVLDLQGRVVVEQHATAKEGVARFNLSKLPTGLYQVQLFDGKKLTQQRIAKE